MPIRQLCRPGHQSRCAARATYKAWFPLTRRWLGFEDADITISPADGIFRVRLLVTPPETGGVALTGFSGRWMARDGLILTAITVSASPTSSG